MSTWIKVARFHLADRFSYTAFPWTILGINFVIEYVLAGSFDGGSVPFPSFNVVVIYIIFWIVGIRAISGSLPFALALGVSRRSYYAGTTLLAIGLAAVNGLLLALLKIAERLTGGWGVGLHFFRVAYILAGPWYLTWLTSFAGLTLVFVYGMWFGLVLRRFGMIGVTVFSVAQVAVALIWVISVSDLHGWAGVGRWFTTLSAAGLTGLLAAFAVVLLAGGYATMRRVTV
jgi:hypothetical protein